MKQWKQIICALVCMMVFVLVPQLAVQAQEMTTDMAGYTTEEILPETEEAVATSQQEQEAGMEEQPEQLAMNDAEEADTDSLITTEAEDQEGTADREAAT